MIGHMKRKRAYLAWCSTLYNARRYYFKSHVFLL